jgi:uncharacterized membrane protein
LRLFWIPGITGVGSVTRIVQRYRIMKPLAKAVTFGMLAAALAFVLTYVAFNFDRWRLEASGNSVCGYIDDGWLVASLASILAYVAVFTPILWFTTRQQWPFRR